ncbi:Dabb family protein [Spirosoma panaciterrae]|uniref:Dabb family protein n=1 Tax=Spirosoma panaciterrae TaxID=496058 RepID=UPI0003711AD3|nr:Dabb family protein [Spirosoma panaciterrae]
MKKQLAPLVLLAILSLPMRSVNAQNQPAKLLRHVVIITFKEGAPSNEIRQVDNSFRNLAAKLKMVRSYETGTAIPEGKQKTVTHVYAFGFASEKDLANYGASPEHQQHMKIGKSIIERGQAVDYWVEK